MKRQLNKENEKSTTNTNSDVEKKCKNCKGNCKQKFKFEKIN